MEAIRFNTYLLQEFAARRRRNRLYSQRAYARDLGVSVGLVSEALAGKRQISYDLGCRIVPLLNLSPYAKKMFLASLLPEAAAAKRLVAETRAERLSDDQFHLIADWYHFAILSLAKTENVRSSAGWIARRLAIAPAEAELALARLRRLGLIKVQHGKLVRTKANVETTPDLPSIAIKESHRQTLEQTIDALFSVPVTMREISSTTVATSPAKIQQAKAMMRAFAEEMQQFLEEGPKTEVYNLNLQLVPVTTIEGATEQ